MNHLRTNFVVQTDSLLKKELSVGCFSLVVNKLLIVHTVSTIQYISYRSKWWFCYPNTRLAEIVQKAGKLPFGDPNGLLAKIMHSNLTNKIKAQLSDFLSVGCAFFLVVYYLFINNFRCSIANVIHLPHP